MNAAFLVLILVMLALLPDISSCQRPKWRPALLEAAFFWFIIGNFFPYAVGDTKNYSEDYILGILLIPILFILSDYFRWRFTLPFYKRIWEKRKGF
jgi:hypothetical protein